MLTVVFEQNTRPYGKVEDGLPRWHVGLRAKEYATIDQKLGQAGVHFVPSTKVGRDVSLRELANDWGFHSVVLANGAWRDRLLPVPDAEKYVGRGLVYQNPFIQWFNHRHEAGYRGPVFEALDDTIVVGGGLASIDVVKAMNLELAREALRAKGAHVDLEELEVEGIPKALEKHGLSWEGLGFKGATLYYRRRVEDMPLVALPDGANEKVVAKIEKTRAHMLEKAVGKYLFHVRPLRAPVALLIENERAVGMRFAVTEMEGGKLVQTADTEEVRGAQVISSIGSIPEPLEGVPQKGELYALQRLGPRPAAGLPDALRGRERGHGQGQHRRLAQARAARRPARARRVPEARGRRGGAAAAQRRAARGAAPARARAPGEGRLPRLRGVDPGRAPARVHLRWPTGSANETSAYLRQHAHNPVDWYPWGDEAWERARREDKPVLVSIGYSSCHWCHVMERESFEDPNVGRLMNDLVVAIKVDREERPDVDQIYMEAVQRMTGSGGWPLNMFCTPDGRPFMGGTYFPPRRMHNRPSFAELVLGVAKAWREQREDVHKAAAEVLASLGARPEVTAPDPLGKESLSLLVRQMMARADRRFGGFGAAPKFPTATNLEAVLAAAQLGVARGDALEHLVFTLERMARGGIFDQLGGGFHRYSTDERWLVPHFEKMLYDNGQLLRVYAEALPPDRADATLAWPVEETVALARARDARPRGRLLRQPGRRQRGRGGPLLRLEPRRDPRRAGRRARRRVLRGLRGRARRELRAHGQERARARPGRRPAALRRGARAAARRARSAGRPGDRPQERLLLDRLRRLGPRARGQRCSRGPTGSPPARAPRTSRSRSSRAAAASCCASTSRARPRSPPSSTTTPRSCRRCSTCTARARATATWRRRWWSPTSCARASSTRARASSSSRRAAIRRSCCGPPATPTARRRRRRGSRCSRWCDWSR